MRNPQSAGGSGKVPHPITERGHSLIRGTVYAGGGKVCGRVPISSPLLAVLQARRNDSAGNPLQSDAFVFGDEAGRPKQSILPHEISSIVLVPTGN